MPAAAVSQWWWCLRHDRAEEGAGCRAADRMGPYDSAEEAARWKERAAAREDTWEEQDERWEGEAPD